MPVIDCSLSVFNFKIYCFRTKTSAKLHLPSVLLNKKFECKIFETANCWRGDYHKCSIISDSPNWLTKFHYFISIIHCFHSKENDYCTILHYICSYKIFDAFTDPILLYIVIHQGNFFFVIVIVFLIAFLLFNGHKVQK